MDHRDPPALAGARHLVAALTVAVGFLWRRFSQVYAIAQTSLRETMSRPPETRHHDRPLSTLLREARLDSIPVAAESVAAGRLLREFALRSLTGASVVGIDRAGTSIVNPGPEEEILPGDVLFLLGTQEHIDAARTLLVPAAIDGA